jgi:hypothetical protein
MTFSITTMYLYSFYVASIGNNPATLLAGRTRNDTLFIVCPLFREILLLTTHEFICFVFKASHLMLSTKRCLGNKVPCGWRGINNEIFVAIDDRTSLVLQRFKIDLQINGLSLVGSGESPVRLVDEFIK